MHNLKASDTKHGIKLEVVALKTMKKVKLEDIISIEGKYLMYNVVWLLFRKIICWLSY